MSDQLTRFLFDEYAIRGEIVKLKNSYQTILSSYNYPPAIEKLLGELMAATTLLSATLKFEGEISLQIQSEGIVKYAVINGTHDQKLRGVARWDESISAFPEKFSDLFTKGILAITITPEEGERYQGIVGLEGESLAKCLEDYFYQSEQLPTSVQLFASAEQTVCASGFLLQVLPQSSETSQASDNPDFEHIQTLANTLTQEELNTLEETEILHRLYHEEAVRLLDTTPVTFECDCSKQRSAHALRNVAKQELLAIVAEEGSVKMNCQFCHTEYLFDTVDIEHIHSDNFSSNSFDVAVAGAKH
ncbi:Hsp33 family molecular chaperone HslO [Agaribacter flavus]|uniref:33 kDa chaperonin n=1 Tax=Agaribacter flavus TaxID=1902781 RepID=A0ABV7FQS8_9ALTE